MTTPTKMCGANALLMDRFLRNKRERLEADVERAHAEERAYPGVREVIESLTAEAELQRFIARHGNGEADTAA